MCTNRDDILNHIISKFVQKEYKNMNSNICRNQILREQKHNITYSGILKFKQII